MPLLGHWVLKGFAVIQRLTLMLQSDLSYPLEPETLESSVRIDFSFKLSEYYYYVGIKKFTLRFLPKILLKSLIMRLLSLKVEVWSLFSYIDIKQELDLENVDRIPRSIPKMSLEISSLGLCSYRWTWMPCRNCWHFEISCWKLEVSLSFPAAYWGVLLGSYCGIPGVSVEFIAKGVGTML